MAESVWGDWCAGCKITAGLGDARQDPARWVVRDGVWRAVWGEQMCGCIGRVLGSIVLGSIVLRRIRTERLVWSELKAQRYRI